MVNESLSTANRVLLTGSGFWVIGMTKLCIIWFATELQRRFDEDGVKIIVTTADPGPIATRTSPSPRA